MPDKWTTIAIPAIGPITPFQPDLMLLLTDGSVLLHNGYVTSVDQASHWARLTPDAHGHYATGTWSGPFDMGTARQWFASGVTRKGHVFVIGGEASSAGRDTPTGEIFHPLTNTLDRAQQTTRLRFYLRRLQRYRSRRRQSADGWTRQHRRDTP